MEKFTDEYVSIIRDGIIYNDQAIKVALRAFICDAPARAFIKKSKGHSGYSACEKCTTRGVRVGGSITFPQVDAQLRTDDSFYTQIDENHHVGDTVSPLLSAGVPMVTKFPLDYMHLVLLGIMKRLLNMWCNKVPYKISSFYRSKLNEKLMIFRSWTPIELTREPRTLNELDR
jgi:hypothetical protein